MVLWMKYPQSNRAKDLLTLERDKLRIGIGLFTGHVSFREHLHKLGFAEQRECSTGRRVRIVFTSCATVLRSLAKDIDFGVIYITAYVPREPGDLAEKRVNRLKGLMSNT